MKIVSMDWAPGSPFYTIHCDCDWQFSCSSNCSSVQCPNCGRYAHIHSLEREWIERTSQKRKNQREKEVEGDKK